MFSLDKSRRCYIPIPYGRLSIGLLEVDVVFLLPGVRLVVDDKIHSTSSVSLLFQNFLTLKLIAVC